MADMKAFKPAMKAKYTEKVNPEKIVKVMREFKARELKSSSGSKVSDRKQAIAIALSEARRNKK